MVKYPVDSTFQALLKLLRAPPPAVAADPGAMLKFEDLVVKCLIKLTKALGRAVQA